MPLEFRRGDVPVRPAFLRHSAQVLAQFFHSGAAEEPVAVVDLIDDKSWFEDDRVGDHRLVYRAALDGCSRREADVGSTCGGAES